MGLTKAQAEKLFKDTHEGLLKGTDSCAKRGAWHDFTDMLCKDGEITQKQYETWDNPKCTG